MVTLPQRGQHNWDVPLNAALTELGDEQAAHTQETDAHGDRAWASGRFLPMAGDQSAFVSQPTFSVAHRGWGEEAPEHTMASYEMAVSAGAPAIEVSCNVTRDGVLVCLHDETLDRTTNGSGALAGLPYATVKSTVQVTPQSLLGNGWENQPLTPLREVLDRYLGRVVIFLEPKSNPSHVPLHNLLDQHYPEARRSVVWKTYFQNPSLIWATANGYTTWGYMDASTTDEQLDAQDHLVDMWGVPFAMSDSRIADVVARGKPVICWEVHRHCDVARLSDLGVAGFMSPRGLYLTKTPFFPTDHFAEQVRVPGTIATTRYDPVRALKYDGDGGAFIAAPLPNGAVLMGGHRAPSAEEHTIRFSMKWEQVPGSTIHSGVAFCREWDDPYLFANANSSYQGLRSPGGYHVVMRGNGDMQLYRHDTGSASGTQLGSVATETPVNDTYMALEVEVTETHVNLRRLDGAGAPYELSVANTAYRGRYWHLSVGSVESATNLPHWRDIEVS